MPRDLKVVDVLGGAVMLFQVEEGQKRPATAVRGAFTRAGYRMVTKRVEQLHKAQDTDGTGGSSVRNARQGCHGRRADSADYFAHTRRPGGVSPESGRA